MSKKNNNLDGWIEARTGVKFLCWGELKDSIQNPDDAVVIAKGDKIQGLVSKIDEQKDGDDIVAYKWNLQAKEYDVPIIVWSNASMFKQIQDIGVDVGDEVLMTYIKDYKTKSGKIGKDIKLKVRKNHG